ncbi:hypothetical protein F3Y22_tig00112383pilonHSYRG00545 [Hibiscus syriacus]|uniref:Reverse transcriptase domain-containing protein n=1 Tax=Hibiscus syriacus TaxID=106335 RepID=A0A6A2X084_HIBSY|nr:hypothetical protein F3Y22_tig00112383pilonHSYRG00545 [Hibiscus syriacus]
MFFNRVANGMGGNVVGSQGREKEDNKFSEGFLIDVFDQLNSPLTQLAVIFGYGIVEWYGHMAMNLVEAINSSLKGVHHLPIMSVVKVAYYRLATLFATLGRQTVDWMAEFARPLERIQNNAYMVNLRKKHASADSSKERGVTEIRFDHSHLKGPATPSIFPTQLMMLPTGDPRDAHDKDDPDCYCDLYLESWLDGNSHSSYNPHKKKSSHDTLYQRYMQGDPSVGPLGEDNGKYQFLVDYSSKNPPMKNQNQTFQPSPHPKPPPNSGILVQPCYKKIQKWIKKNPEPHPQPIVVVCMFQPSDPTYDTEFPPLEEFTKTNYRHTPKIPNPLAGENISAAEATLNWQSENALAQNSTLKKIDSKISQMDSKLSQMESKGLIFPSLSAEKKKPTTYELYQQIKRQEAEKKRERDKGKKKEEDDYPSPKFSRALMIQQKQQNPLTSFLKEYQEAVVPKIAAVSHQEATSEEVSDNESSEKTSIARQPSAVGGGRYVFTLDDIPVSRWPQRFQEFHSWMETHKLTRDSNYDILTEFVSRFTGVLRDWWMSIPQGDQIQFLVQQDFATVIRVMHNCFLGNPDDIKTLKRKEFFKRKCCSYKKKDMEKHFSIMTKLFYALGAEQSLKHAILASIPELVQNDIHIHLQQQRKDILQLTVGEIQQETFIAVEELCDRKKIIKDYMTGTRELDQACKEKGFTIKCKPSQTCHCKPRTRGNKYSKKYSQYPFIPKKGEQMEIFEKEESHSSKMIQQIQEKTGIKIREDDDVESLFSIEEEPTDQTLFAIQNLIDSSEDEFSETERVFILQSKISSSIVSVVPIPHVPATVYLGKYEKPISVIAFIDTGAAETIMNPEVLPPEWWKPHTRYFNSAADQTFATHLISKPITIQFFPGCAVTTIVLGSQLPGKDLVVGFDLYTKAKHLRILPNGLKYKQMFKPFVEISRLYLLETKQRINGTVRELKVKACAESHEEFLSKCDHPLWRNSEFFIQLPFKKNKDINPMKASHSGMNPEHQKLAESECVDLLQQGLIEPSDSQWACEAFYVNKRSEQARGKLRLVINYQPLNQFLQDDKFPLPNRNALFSSLARAQIFSKFDLKAGFSQMGINPIDRPKTGFCIPNHHYQWKVMPFGLKTAPSLFQKAMIKIFQPVMENALIYIDDILLYSPNKESHLKLLEKFRQLVLQYGIMLSEKKMHIYQQEIQFLWMNLKKGQYHPGPHIAQELLKFPEKDFTKKQILQFLGIVNYLRDFIPKISKYTNPLRKMLKKDPPPWKDVQTKAVKGAVLLKEKDQKRYVCRYKSGRFSDAEIHYHSTFKEILAVKKGITKFEFHLIGYHFLVEMDMSSFPQMLKFKQKVIPNPQLLRWAEWFSKYSFDCKHIKASSSSSSKPPKKPKTQPETTFSIPPNLNPEFPPEVYRLVIEGTFHSNARDMIFEYQLELFRFYGGLFLKPHGLHPDYPFIHPIPFEFTEVPDELKWLLWYFTHIHHVAIQFHLEDLQYFLDKAIRGKAQPKLCMIHPELKNLFVILEWFYPLPQWLEMVNTEAQKTPGQYILIVFYKPHYFLQHGAAKQLGTLPTAWIHRIYPDDVRKLNQQYRDLQRYLCQINRQIPIEVWPPPDVDAPWDTWPSDPSLLTPYYKSIMEALKPFKEMILDPSEWSQEYPLINSVSSKRGESSQPPEHPLSQQTNMVPAPEEDKMEMDPEARYEAYQLKCYRRKQEKKDRIIELNITSDESTDYSDISL